MTLKCRIFVFNFKCACKTMANRLFRDKTPLRTAIKNHWPETPCTPKIKNLRNKTSLFTTENHRKNWSGFPPFPPHPTPPIRCYRWQYKRFFPFVTAKGFVYMLRQNLIWERPAAPLSPPPPPPRNPILTLTDCRGLRPMYTVTWTRCIRWHLNSGG